MIYQLPVTTGFLKISSRQLGYAHRRAGLQSADACGELLAVI